MNDQSHNDKHSRFFKKTQIPYSRSKEDVWNDMMAQIQERQDTRKKTRHLIFYWAAAAVFILLFGVTAVIRFYTNTLYAPPGQHVSNTLPDGSKVHLNAGTSLSYHPHWWRFARIMELEGEAYFEVEEGNPFTVKSPRVSTQVLGTSFNVYARNNEYRVHCIIGQVKVNTKTGVARTLEANQSLRVTAAGETEYHADAKAQHAIAWTKNRFVFTAVPLKEVLNEMERQYDIDIDLAPGVKGKYTGNFKRGGSVKETLEMIARPFGLEVNQLHQNKYRISKKED